MRVPLCGLRLAVTEQPANNRQRHAGTHADACRRVPEIVQAHALEVGRRAKSVPRLCEIHERLSAMPPLDDVIAGKAIRAIMQVTEHAKGSIA